MRSIVPIFGLARKLLVDERSDREPELTRFMFKDQVVLVLFMADFWNRNISF